VRRQFRRLSLRLNIRRFCPLSEVAATVKERPLKNSQLSIPERRKTPPGREQEAL
jgi:hypothetical protein